MLEGMFDWSRFLTLVQDFIVFEDDGSGELAKKMAGYHQFHAVETAVQESLRAAALQREAKESLSRVAGTNPSDNQVAISATGALASFGTPRVRARA